jgi:hypothetical protein
VAWTVSQLVRVLLLKGDRSAARQTFEESGGELATAEPGSRVAALIAETLLALADGDRGRAVELAKQAVVEERGFAWPNVVAERTWWTGRLFGADAVGGDRIMDEARATLETAHWIASIKEPDQFLEAFAAVS